MNEKNFDSDFDATLIDFADGRTEYIIGTESPFPTRRSVLIDDHRGNTWVATFICPDMGRKTLTRLVAMPNPRRLAAVIRGVLFLGNVDDPASFEQIAASGSIQDIRSYPEENVVVVTTPLRILCLDENGVRWRSHRLALEGVSLGEASGNLLHATVDNEETHQIDLFINNGKIAHSTFTLPESFYTG